MKNVCFSKCSISFREEKNKYTPTCRRHKLLLILFILLSGFFNLQSQNCNTPAAPDMVGCIAPWASTSAQGPFFIKVKFHKLAGSSGLDVLDSHIDECKIEMDRTFNPLNIYFIYDCENSLLNLEAQVANTETQNNLCEIVENTIQGYLNIFVGAPTALALNVAESSPGNWLVVSGSDTRFQSQIPAYNSKILSHEIGHCLSLFHTHFGNGESETGNNCGASSTVEGCADNSTNSNNCSEPTSLANVCGDCICDTPADPNLLSNSTLINNTCVYTGDTSLTPLLNNIMSYVWAGCLEDFTPKQAQRMRDFLASSHPKALNMQYVESGSTINITSNFATWSTQYYNDKLVIKNGAKLSITNKSILVTKEFQINVESGGTLIIDNSSLRSCTQLYRGIIAESGSTIIIRNGTIIADALYAVEMDQNANVSITNSFLNDCYVGVYIKAGANLSGFRNNTIQTLYGVKPTTFAAPLWSNNTYIGIKADIAAQGFIGGLAVDNNYGNNFKNLHYGIKSEGADLIIIGNRFENMIIHPGELAPNSNYTYVSGTAIYDVGSVYTYAKGNQVNNCRYGVYGLRIGGDFISNEISNCSTTGILLRDNRSRKIGVTDNIIYAGYTGVEFFNINGGTVVNNVISTTASQEGESTTGVICRFGSNNTIADNNISFLNQKPIHVGIASSNGKTHTITNNTIYGYTSPTSKALALLGGNTHTANCNLTIDFKDGIYTDNSTGNILDCNVLESEVNDININVNSPMQIIKGNSFSYGSLVNLFLDSPLGVQDHHGNNWVENSPLGSDAKALSLTEVENSKFKADFSKSDTQNKGWYPKKNGIINSDPANLFEDVDEPIGNPTYECSGCTYGFGNFSTWFNGSPSPEALCNWLNTSTLRLRPAQIKWWQTYIYRLLKKSGRSYASLTMCLKTIWDSVNSTKQKNVETINDKLTALSSVHQSNTGSAYTLINNIVADAAAGQPFNQTGYNAAIISIRTSISGNVANESSLYIDINAELTELSTDTAYSDETLIYATLLDYLQNSILPGNNTIRLISEKCTDDNGENVYLAKDLLSLVGEVNPLGNDCHDAQNRSFISNMTPPAFARIYPTLSNGIYTIDLFGGDDARYLITVTSMVGQKVKELVAHNGIVSLDLSDKNNGLYIIIIKDKDDVNNVSITKVIKVE